MVNCTGIDVPLHHAVSAMAGGFVVFAPEPLSVMGFAALLHGMATTPRSEALTAMETKQLQCVCVRIQTTFCKIRFQFVLRDIGCCGAVAFIFCWKQCYMQSLSKFSL